MRRAADGWLYDGRSAVRRPVMADAAEGDLILGLADGEHQRVPPSKLFHVDAQGETRVYGRTDVEGWRLGLPLPLAPDLAALLPGTRRYGRWIDRVGLVPALAVMAGVSAAVLGLGYLLPGQLAPYIPASWEQRYGDAIVGDFGGKFCRGAAGQAALDRLAAKLSPAQPGRTRRAFDIRVVDLPIVNAAALPGNHIVLFRKLLTDADGPDEVAGVLAHEIAHVDNRDIAEGMIRELGVGLVVTALGGTTGGNADMLLGSRYGRAAEAEADASAIAMLSRADVSPVPTAKFFGKLAAPEKSLGQASAALSYLSTHPLSTSRRAAFQNSYRPARAYTPALGRADWDAVTKICQDAGSAPNKS